MLLAPLLFLALGALCLLPASAYGNRWRPSSVVVLRVNDNVLGGGSSQYIWLDEVTPSGALRSSTGPLGCNAQGCNNPKYATLRWVGVVEWVAWQRRQP